jgi:triacylglycerol lipase
MGFYENNQILDLSKEGLKNYFTNKQITPKICVLIHGLTNNETIWAFPDEEDYGKFLQKDFAYTSFYLRYNTGLHISDNGKLLAEKMQQLMDNYPINLKEITFITHSMGGLITHSACFYAQLQKLNWTSKIKNIFLLATPHLGSFVEKFANVTTNILEKVPNWHTRMVGKLINLRSAGIKDLRFGYLTEEEWKNEDPDKLLKNNKSPVKKLTNVNYYVISARLTKQEKHWASYLFGDLLVSRKSATGRSKNLEEFNFSPENTHEFAKTYHFELNTRIEVYEKIKEWLLSNPQ